MLLLDWRRGSGIGLARLQRATQVLAGAAWETSIGEWGTDRGRSAGRCAVSGLSALDRARVEKRQVGWQGIGAGDALQVRQVRQGDRGEFAARRCELAESTRPANEQFLAESGFDS
ncbi:hypothetical protein BFG51_04540 [Dietzia alimentaria]|nr:hypothetical protein BFG51_04540 [Dietzia alimentaria]